MQMETWKLFIINPGTRWVNPPGLKITMMSNRPSPEIMANQPPFEKPFSVHRDSGKRKSTDDTPFHRTLWQARNSDFFPDKFE
jgi:hypothetical protein